MKQDEGRRFAVDEAGVTVDAIALKESSASQSRRIFSCAGCGGRMYFKPGNVRRPHFAHYTDDRPCGGETYLHKLGKRVFREVFEECVKNGRSFTLSVLRPYSCVKNIDLLGNMCHPRKLIAIPHDLVRSYQDVVVERWDSGFTPDLKLIHRSKSEKDLWIEIKVKHGCDKSKLDSGRKIVEISLSSEEDISLIRKATLIEGEKVSCFNFERTKEEGQSSNECFCDQSGQLRVFVVYTTGKFFVKRGLSMKEARAESSSQAYVFSKVLNARFYGAEVVWENGCPGGVGLIDAMWEAKQRVSVWMSFVRLPVVLIW